MKNNIKMDEQCVLLGQIMGDGHKQLRILIGYKKKCKDSTKDNLG